MRTCRTSGGPDAAETPLALAEPAEALADAVEAWFPVHYTTAMPGV